jgi:hypothetical protein
MGGCRLGLAARIREASRGRLGLPSGCCRSATDGPVRRIYVGQCGYEDRRGQTYRGLERPEAPCTDRPKGPPEPAGSSGHASHQTSKDVPRPNTVVKFFSGERAEAIGSARQGGGTP